MIEQLEGLELPAAAWERDVLPARIADYEPARLDELCLSGCTTPSFPAAGARARSCAAWSPTATAAATTRWSAAWPPPSSWCTARRWCRTICPASTTPTTRRGLPACHVVYGEATAILVGDALLDARVRDAGQRAGAPRAGRLPLDGRCSPRPPASRTASSAARRSSSSRTRSSSSIYHRHKTAALFRAAAAGGAICCGAEADVSRWARIGELIGCALQLRDDMDDVGRRHDDIGKPTGRDAALGRPNAALQAGPRAPAPCAPRHRRRRELLGPSTPETEALHRLVEEVTRPAQVG